MSVRSSNGPIFLLGMILILGTFAFFVVDSFSQTSGEPTPTQPKTNLVGTLTDSDTGNPIPNALISLRGLTDTNESLIQKAITDKNGEFAIPFVVSGPATVTYEAEGYLTIQDQGLPLQASQDLSKILQKVESVGGWWVLVLLAPGILGLAVASWKEKQRGEDAPPALEGLSIPASPSATVQIHDNQFFIAMLSGFIWGGTLVALLWMGNLNEYGVYTIRLFTPSLTFELYIPILGFLGALLYVLDLSRRGKEDIPKGKEFGMRLIMGPYVAIIMVILFGHELGLANLSSPVARGTLAFFSGLLVVTALQGLIERAQEKLGKWRKENMDDPAKISDRLDLSPEEELLIRRKEFEKEQLEKALGGPIWEKLKESKITTVEEFAHLTDQSLEHLAAKVSPAAELEDLKILRTKAKKFGNLEGRAHSMGTESQ